jgi:tRNA U55 pseudouridine synthase TruB
MVGLDEVEAWTVDQMPPWCQPADAALQHLPAISLDRDAMEHLLHGRQARVGPGEAQLLRAYGPDGRFLGLADRSEEGGLRVRRLFVEPGGTSSTQTDLSSDPARM